MSGDEQFLVLQFLASTHHRHEEVCPLFQPAVKHRRLLAAYPWERIQTLGGPSPPVIIDVKGFWAKRPETAGAMVWQL